MNNSVLNFSLKPSSSWLTKFEIVVFTSLPASQSFPTKSDEIIPTPSIVLRKINLFSKAVEYYDKVLSLVPEHFIAWFNKANDLARLNKDEEAIACYSEAIKLHPTDSSYWTNKGLVLLLQREYAKAVACFDESLRLNPLNKTAKTYRTSAKEKQGENKFV